ncbi:hypothetical protein BLA60_34385 [Actinophytocola xinjiangensis]|uniref:Uncharacterized protein n=2 Tax=Actinophytocola xinjiangensis TaxID=485602 RepID=A0A7Z0WFT1_9PSEU|nr:hypothetical protein BLA60_34385 [Actinophytocola xinjiangensis]
MSGSQRFLGPLAAVRELFVRCPVDVEMSSVRIGVDAGGVVSALVRLRNSDPAVLAAGIVQWRRTLVRGNTWAWRGPAGDGFHIVTTGFGEDGGVAVAVVAGPVPAGCCLDLELPGEIDDDVLYRWLGDEIANNWPFETKPGELS